MQSLDQLDDSILIARAKSDPEAFGVLYERYVSRIYNYVFYRVGSHEDAEDLTARTFFQALDKIGDYEDRGAPFTAWLFRIAHNLVANWHRHRSRHRSVPLEALSLSANPRGAPGVVAERTETMSELLQAVRRLPEDRQQLLLLKFIDRMPNAQIGEIMGRTESSIKSLYHRTLNSLRQDLEERDLL